MSSRKHLSGDNNNTSRSNSPSPSDSSEEERPAKRPAVKSGQRPKPSRAFLSQPAGGLHLDLSKGGAVNGSGNHGSKTSSIPRFPEMNPFSSLPAFRPQMSLPKVFSPLLSPRSQPSGVQRGFFDSIPLEKSSSSPALPRLHAPMARAPTNTPNMDEQLFRVRRSPDPVPDRNDYVAELPDHLPSSPLCPKNPKNSRTKGRGVCPVHGPRPLSDEDEEAEDVVKKKTKDLEKFL